MESLEAQIGEVEISPESMLKLLAKIAYGFCVFHYGEGFFDRSYLPKMITGSMSDGLGRYVGSVSRTELELRVDEYEVVKKFRTKYHLVELIESQGTIFVLIRLFKEIESKFYYVVHAGEV